MERTQKDKLDDLTGRLLQIQKSPDLSPKRKYQLAVIIEDDLYEIAFKGEVNPCYSYQNLLNYFSGNNHLSVLDIDSLKKAFADIYIEAIDNFRLPDRLNLDNYIDAHSALSFMIEKSGTAKWLVEETVQQKFVQHFKKMITDDSSQEARIKEFVKVLFGRNIL